MVDPASLMTGFKMTDLSTYLLIFLGIAVFAFFSGLGTEVAKYIFERYVRHRLDKVDIKVKPGEIEITTKKRLRHAGTRDIYVDNDGEKTEGEWRH